MKMIPIRREGQIVEYVQAREIAEIESLDDLLSDFMLVALKRRRPEGRWFVAKPTEFVTLLPKRWRPA